MQIDVKLPASVGLIAAIGRNRELGKDNKLLWDLPADRKRFKILTQGRPVIMGRKTFDSIIEVLGKPFDAGRTNIVVTRNTAWSYSGVFSAPSVKEALQLASNYDDYPFVIGGENIYLDSLVYADLLWLTLVDDAPQATAYFPPFKHLFKQKEEHTPQEQNGLRFKWVEFERIRYT